MDTSLSPYLHFNGNCEDAMNFYKSVFGGELEISRFEDFAGAEMPVSEAQKNKVMHSTLQAPELMFMASDSQEGRELVVGDNVSMSIAGTDSEKLTRYFNGLSEGGNVTMPLAQVPWGASFGMLTDKYGVHWMVNISPTKA